jgi:hypothetical protein
MEGWSRSSISNGLQPLVAEALFFGEDAQAIRLGVVRVDLGLAADIPDEVAWSVSEPLVQLRLTAGKTCWTFAPCPLEVLPAGVAAMTPPNA